MLNQPCRNPPLSLVARSPSSASQTEWPLNKSWPNRAEVSGETLLSRIRICGLAVCGLVLLLSASGAFANDLVKEYEARTTRHVLANGWTFLIVERPVAPVFSFATVVNVGSAQEVPGITGLAHMFEHMAFKGTPNIGTLDFEAEKVALDEVEAAYQAYDSARRSPSIDEAEVERRLAVFHQKQTAARQFVIANEFGNLIEINGGTGLNASTNTDFTNYFYSLPANRFELFAYLESERFLHPVFREFYKERDVVQEERRLRTESRPIGRLIEQAMSTAFVAHPYKQPVVGYMSDLQSFTATDAREFYRTYYVPANMVTTLVGHLKAEAVIPTLEKYFGRIPGGPEPPELRTVEPPQIGEKTVTLREPSQPIYLEFYHKPGRRHPDQEVYDAIDDILSNGRASRLYRSLVRDKKIAASLGSFSGFPGNKYPNLWAAVVYPAKGVSNAQVRSALREELEKLRSEPVSAAELQRFKTRAKADLLRQLNNNTGLAFQLSLHQTIFGDWRELFRSIDRIEKVSAEDILRVARATFVANNRTVAMIETESPATESSAQPSGSAH